jgi:hypothetical protein
MSQVGDDHLTHWAIVTGHGGPPIEDSRMVVLPRDTLQLDPPPRGTLRPVDFLHLEMIV